MVSDFLDGLEGEPLCSYPPYSLEDLYRLDPTLAELKEVMEKALLDYIEQEEWEVLEASSRVREAFYGWVKSNKTDRDTITMPKGGDND